jgi:hypothetical protein
MVMMVLLVIFVVAMMVLVVLVVFVAHLFDRNRKHPSSLLVLPFL